MKKRCALLVSLAVFLVLVSLCVWQASRVDWEYFWAITDGGQHTMPQEWANYIFDPRIIATAIPEGDFLTPVPPETPIPTSEPIPGLAVWDESVLFRLAARAFEEGSEMQLIGVGFDSPCAAAGSGLSSMGFQYLRRRTRDEMKKVEYSGRYPYLHARITVNLDGVRYYAGVSTYFMNAAAAETRRPPVDYEGLEIKALEAIRLAEDHGGREFRNQVGNACEIYGGLKGVPPVWSVRYRREGEESPALEFRINAESGEVVVGKQ